MSLSVLIDSCIIIDHLRSRDKSNTFLVKILDKYDSLYISTVIEYEILAGATELRDVNWTGILKHLSVLSFDRRVAVVAARIRRELKSKRQQMDSVDLFIAATAKTFGLPLATLNQKHFKLVDTLDLIRLQ